MRFLEGTPRLLIRTAIVLLASSLLHAQVPKSYHGTSGGWGPTDRNHLTHALAGAYIAAPAYLAAEALGYGDPNSKSWLKRNLKPWMHALIWAGLAGGWKENYDRHHGGRPEYGDLGYTILGGAAVCIPIHFARAKKAEYATAAKLNDNSGVTVVDSRLAWSPLTPADRMAWSVQQAFTENSKLVIATPNGSPLSTFDLKTFMLRPENLQQNTVQP